MKKKIYLLEFKAHHGGEVAYLGKDLSQAVKAAKEASIKEDRCYHVWGLNVKAPADDVPVEIVSFERGVAFDPASLPTLAEIHEEWRA